MAAAWRGPAARRKSEGGKMPKTYMRIAAAALLFAGLAIPARAEIGVIGPALLNDMLSSGNAPTVVDVRGASDFAKGHIPGAVNAAYNTIERAGLPKDAALVFYCGNDQCPLSHLAARTLEPLGYKKLLVLGGGLSAWEAGGFPVDLGGGIARPEPSPKISFLQAGELIKRLSDKETRVIDLRPAGEFRIAHISGAVNVPLEILEGAAASFSKEKSWTVYDVDNERAKAGARLLLAKGFEAKVLSGGLQVWAARKYPMESGGGK